MFLTNPIDRANTWLLLKQLRNSISYMEDNLVNRDYTYALRKEKEVWRKEVPKVLVA